MHDAEAVRQTTPNKILKERGARAQRKMVGGVGVKGEEGGPGGTRTKNGENMTSC